MPQIRTQRNETTRQIEAFWGTEACGAHFVSDQLRGADFYEEYRRFRYETEWHIRELVPFSEARGKRVLEIGCGNGADGVLFAMNGADYVGVDLTSAAVEATRAHFEALNLHGEFRIEDAQRLSFADASFDIVYSYGVLHHTSNPEHAIAEVHRVLKPGGRAIVMLYNKQSFNYRVRIMLYMRLRVLLKIFSRVGRINSDKASIGSAGSGMRGNADAGLWLAHYRNFLRDGWGYLRADRFVHHATDGPDCPYAYAYTKSDVQRMFSRFSDVRTSVAHFPLRKYRLGRLIPFFAERLLASRIGWYVMIFARK